MFTELESNIIIMALMYFYNDHTPEDIKELSNPNDLKGEIETLIEDFVGPTWDQEGTLENIVKQTALHSRKS